jgi:hypothetical protein
MTVRDWAPIIILVQVLTLAFVHFHAMYFSSELSSLTNIKDTRIPRCEDYGYKEFKTIVMNHKKKHLTLVCGH